jgi:hypothetical protein
MYYTVLESWCFVVANKQVGFYILNTRYFACDKFKCFFHLWNNGGPDWQREWRHWQDNNEKEWTLVSPSKRRAHLGFKALSKPRSNSAIKHTVSLAKSLKFAPTIQYEARKGYGPKDQVSKENLMVHWTKTSPSINFATVRPLENLEKDQQGDHVNKPISKFHSEASSIIQAQPDAGVVRPRLEPTGLEKVVDDIAFRFWKCHKCLSMTHTIVNCTNKIRCWDCFNYGHIAKDYLKKKSTSQQQWVPKQKALDLLGRDLRSQSTQPITAVSSPVSQLETPSTKHNQGNNFAQLAASF